MPLSNITDIPLIAEGSHATPGLWNNIFGVIDRDLDQINNDASGATAGLAGFSTNTIRVESGATTTFVSGASLIVSNLNSIRFLTPSGGDDTSTIQAVLNALPTGGFGSLRGGLVQLSAGTFITSSSLSVPPGCVLRGVSREGSTISFGGGGFAIIIGVGTTTNNKGVAIENLHIRGGASATGAIQIGDTNVGSNFVSDLKLSHLQISDFIASGVTALFLQNPSHVYVDLVHVYNCPSGTALHVDANGLNTGVYVFNACRFGGSSSIEVKKACVLTSTSNVIDGIVFTGTFFRGTEIVLDIDNATATDFFGCHFESSSINTTIIRVKTWLASSFLGNTIGAGAVAPIAIHITGTGSAKRLLIGNNWMTNFPSGATAIMITPPGVGSLADITLLPNHFTVGPAPVEFDDSSNAATIISDASIIGTRYYSRQAGTGVAPAFTFSSDTLTGLYRAGALQLGVGSNNQILMPSNSAINPGYAFTSEASLGLWRSTGSTIEISYGQFAINIGSQVRPGLGFASDKSLGWYRSGVSTMALSYGSFNLNQARLVSQRTLAASAITVSAANTNVIANEVVFTVGGASGASLAIHSGGTVYIFDSVSSAKAT
jgi:hypothetical protein